MPKETDIIDSLFLELSQFTQATTAKELALQKERDVALAKCAEMREALSELADLMDEVRAGEYKPDHYTTQIARAALKEP